MVSSIQNSKKFFRIDELKSLGYSLYHISKMVKEGDLEKINRKTYENKNFAGEDSDFYYAYAYVPKGTVCMMSAAVYYGLTTFRPDTIDIAIPRKSKVSTLPEWPEITLHYYTQLRYEKGIETVSCEGNEFQIYDIEKTVCDIVFYRNLIGIEETKEVLKNYLANEARNLNKLIRYARELRCDDVLNTYLEVLL